MAESIMKTTAALAITAANGHAVVWGKNRTLNRKCRLLRCDPIGILP